jgi:hypothetical protein
LCKENSSLNEVLEGKVMSENVKSVAWMKSGAGVITMYADKVYTVGTDHKNYQGVYDALKAKDYEQAVKLADLQREVREAVQASPAAADKITVRDGQVLYGNEEVHGVVVDRILQFVREGLDFEPMVLFLDNLLRNPSKNSVDSLYPFLEKWALPINEKGYFLAWKNVRTDYSDHHSGKFDNHPGVTNEMPRNKVSDNINEGCSYGFHVGSFEYAKTFGSGGHLMLCEVNPADVVSVPLDCSHQKCRVCEYTVLREYTDKDGPLTQSEVTPRVAEDEDDDSDYEDTSCPECDEELGVDGECENKDCENCPDYQEEEAES